MSTQRATTSTGYVVADIGGTTLRIGSMRNGHDEVSSIQRFRTESLRLHVGESGQQLQGRVLRQLVRELSAFLKGPEGENTTAVGLSFAGPMTRDGVVTAAPTIWGPGAKPVCLKKVLENALGLPVFVANDITAAAWRYADHEAKPFCLITVSSGIGNKVFWGREALVDDEGYGGELGHWRVDGTEALIRCDCGGSGHLGAVASGRGMVALAQILAERHPKRFMRSALHGSSRGRTDAITSVHLVAAVQQGDAFAVHILRQALRPMATALSCLFAAIGVRRFLFIGGFALAIGQPYLELLGDELVELGCFGLREPEIRGMLALGAADDEHSLIGLGRMMSVGLLALDNAREQDQKG